MATKVEMQVLKKQILHGTNCSFCKAFKTLLMSLSLADHSLNAASWLQLAIKPSFPSDRALAPMLHAHINSILLTYCYLRWQLQILLNVTAEYVYSLMPQKHRSRFSIFKAIRTIRVHPKQEQYLYPLSLKTVLLLLYNAQCKVTSHRQSLFARNQVFSRVADGNGFK